MATQHLPPDWREPDAEPDEYDNLVDYRKELPDE